MTTIFARNDKLENGHYVVMKELGLGGMGVVYHCRDEFLQRDVAIKMLLPELMKDSKNVQVFTQEARLAAHLEHPNIVTVYDIGVEERDKKDHHFVAMEYLPGGTLAKRTQNGALPIEHALNWMKQLANGLNFAHKKGVVHQDIKADNILITLEGDLKIGDFGLARLMANKVYINPTNKGMGTPAYMSPELCRGEQQDHRSDIYSLGVLFFEMATGQLPYRANGMIEMAMKHTTAPIPSVRRINPNVSEALDRLIRKMMEKERTDRYQSLTEVIERLDDLIFDMRVARMGLMGKTQSMPVLESPGTAPPAAAAAAKGLTAPAARTAPPVEPPKAVVATPTVVVTANPASKMPESKPVAPSPPPVAPSPPVKQEEKPAPKEPETQPLRTRKEDPGISSSKIRAAGIKIPEQIGPARQPSQEIVFRDPRASAYEIPVLEGLSPVLLEKWKFATNGPIGWSSKPTMSDDQSAVFIASMDGYLYKIDTASGSLAWSHRASSVLLTSPVIRGKEIWQAAVDGTLLKLRDSNGERIWKRRVKGGIVATPAMAGNRMIVVSLDGVISAIDTAAGDIIWEYSTNAPMVGNPVLYGDIVFVGNRNGDLYCLNVATGRREWKVELNSSIVSTPATSVDSVYLGTQSGTFYALDIQSGQSLWEYQTPRGIISSPQIIFTSVVFCSQDKWLYCCEKYDGSLKWKAAVRGNVQTALSVAAKTILATSREGWMQGYDVHSGQLKWQRNFGQRLESCPLVLKDALVVANVEGVITYFVFSTDQLRKSA